MYQLQAEVEIDAPPERVWEVLTDFARYPEWSGWRGSISGEARRGAWLKVVATPRPGKLKLTLFRILVCEPLRELRWHALYGPLWSLAGQRYWVLEPRAGTAPRPGDGAAHSASGTPSPPRPGTRLIFGEAYFGWLVPLLRGMLQRDGPRKYEALALRLKAYCENPR